MEKKARFFRRHHLLVLVATAVLFSAAPPAAAQLAAGDAAAMRALAKTLDPAGELGWSESSDPCGHWVGVRCSGDRVVAIQASNRGLAGILPPDVRNLTALTRLELRSNSLSGPLPSLTGLATLDTLFLADNNFSSIPGDFFSGLSSLTNVYLDGNPLAVWNIPPSLRDASGLPPSHPPLPFFLPSPLFSSSSLSVSLQSISPHPASPSKKPPSVRFSTETFRPHRSVEIEESGPVPIRFATAGGGTERKICPPSPPEAPRRPRCAAVNGGAAGHHVVPQP